MLRKLRLWLYLVFFTSAFWSGATAFAQPKTPLKKPNSTGRPELALQLGHSLLVLSLAYSPDGSTLASAGGDGTIKLWDGHARELIRTIPAHTGAVRAVAWSPDGSTLASASEDGTVKFWNPQNGRLQRTIAARPAIANPALRGRACALAYSPDGSTLAVGYGDGGGEIYKGELVLFDARSGTTRRTLTRNIGVLNAVAFSPDGKTLASSGKDDTLRLWNIQTGATSHTLTGQSVSSLVFSPDGKILASGGWDKTVRLWRASDGSLLRTLAGHESHVLAIAFSPDGNLLASSGHDKQLLVWDARSGRRLRTLANSKGISSAVAFSRDGTTLVNASGREIHAFDAKTGMAYGIFEERLRQVKSLAYSPDGKTLAVAGGRKEPIQLWDTQTGRLSKTLESTNVNLRSLAYSPGGELIAASGETAGGSDCEIFIWNARTGTLLRRLEGHKNVIYSLAFSPDGKILASGTIGGNKTSQGEIKFWNPQTAQSLRTISSQAGSVSSLAFSRDGRLLAIGIFSRKDNGSVEIRNTQNGQLLRTISGGRGWVQSVDYARDGSTLAVAGRDGQVRLWNARTGAFLKSFAHGDWIRSVTFSPDGSTLASSGNDNLIRMWNVKSGKLLHILRGHEDGVGTLAFSPTGSTLASGSWDTTVRIWNTHEGRQLASLLTAPPEAAQRHLNVEPLWLTTTPEGYYNCAEGADYLIKWRFGGRLMPFYHFEETYRRPDLLERALQGERIAARPLLITRVPPAIRLLALANHPDKPGKIRVLMQAADDSQLTNSNFQFYVNGVLIPDEVATPHIEEGKPIVVDGKPIVVDGKPIIVDGKPIIVDGKPIVVDGKPIVVDGKPITADGRSVPGFQKIRATDGAEAATPGRADSMAQYGFHRLYVMDIALPAEEKIVLRAVVTDNEGNKSDDGLTMQRPQIEPQKGNLYVLAIGVSSYRNPLYNISYAASDARSIAATLETQSGRQYSKVHTTVLNDRQATRDGILAALSTLKSAGPNDTVMVFLSGHGIAAGGKTYFAPWGVFVRDLAQTSIEWHEIVSSLSGLYAKKLLFTDACHSGARLGNWQATNSQLAEAVRRASGIVMFASSQADEFSFEDKEVKQGVFSLALAEGFAGKADINGDGNITLPELAMYVPERVSKSTRGLQNPQLVLVQDFNPQTVLTKTD